MHFNKKFPTASVAELLSDLIDCSPKSQLQLAREVGFEQPNIISMIKRGSTKLPINRVPAMASALGVDPVELLAMCLKEYQPENWEAIEPLLDLALSADELRILRALRASVGTSYLACIGEESKSHLDALLKSLRDEQGPAHIQ